MVLLEKQSWVLRPRRGSTSGYVAGHVGIRGALIPQRLCLRTASRAVSSLRAKALSPVSYMYYESPGRMVGGRWKKEGEREGKVAGPECMDQGACVEKVGGSKALR